LGLYSSVVALRQAVRVVQMYAPGFLLIGRSDACVCADDADADDAQTALFGCTQADVPSCGPSCRRAIIFFAWESGEWEWE
jgi:hypothetical protein